MEQKIPNHLAIILDGNGRWAQKRGLPRSKGHLEGSKNVVKVAKYAFNKGVKVLSLFAFSTENFKRSKDEVDYLMTLFVKFFTSKLKDFQKNGIKVIFLNR
jgi:undecaprenyl diphosphate synthase